MARSLFFLLLLSLCAGVRAIVPAIIVFGDSSVDAGNNNHIKTVLKSNFEPYGRDFAGGQPTGRFCNGRIATDFISEAFGLKPTIPAYLDPAYTIKDFVDGVCFASAGTGYDVATSHVLVCCSCSLLRDRVTLTVMALDIVVHFLIRDIFFLSFMIILLFIMLYNFNFFQLLISIIFFVMGVFFSFFFFFPLFNPPSLNDMASRNFWQCGSQSGMVELMKNVIPLFKELDYFKEYQSRLRTYVGDEKAAYIISEALYIISVGTNDFLENYYLLPKRKSQYSVDEYQDYLVGLAKDFVKAIYDLGGRKITLGGLPPMGCLPLERTANLFGGNKCREEYNSVARNFNGKVLALVDEMRQKYQGLQLVSSQLYDKFLEVIEQSSTYGFENAALGCCATGLFEMGYLCDKWSPFTCNEANKYVFWDSFHPSEKTNQILANYVMNATLSVFL